MKANFRTALAACALVLTPSAALGQGYKIQPKTPAAGPVLPNPVPPGQPAPSPPGSSSPAPSSPESGDTPRRGGFRTGLSNGPAAPGGPADSPFAQGPFGPRTDAPARGAQQDAYAGQWSGQGTWQLPNGPVLTFPVKVQVTRAGQGYTMTYSAEIPPVAGGIQASPTRWEASFHGSLQRPQAYGQTPQPGQPTEFLMGQSQNYRALILQTGAQQGPWPASMGLSSMNGQLMGQVGSPDFGFAQFQLTRSGVTAAPQTPGGLPHSPTGLPQPAGPAGPAGRWTGTAFDELENGQPLQYEVALNVTRTPNGQVAAALSTTIPYTDPSSGQTYQLQINETFSGSLSQGGATLQCANVRLLEGQSRQVLETFPATLRLTMGPQGLAGSLGNDEMGWTEIRFQRSAAPSTPGYRPGAGYGPQR